MQKSMKIVFDNGIFALLNHVLTIHAVPLRSVLNNYLSSIFPKWITYPHIDKIICSAIKKRRRARSSHLVYISSLYPLRIFYHKEKIKKYHAPL